MEFALRLIEPPDAGACTIIVSVAVADTANPLIVHWRCDGLTALHGAPLVDTIVPPPFVMRSTTDVAVASGPLFVTTTVYVTLAPALTGSGESLFVIERSAAGLMNAVCVEVLFAVF